MHKTLDTGLARVLARPARVDVHGLAEAWYDQTFTFRLRGAGRVSTNIGGHLRRSFLGALRLQQGLKRFHLFMRYILRL